MFTRQTMLILVGTLVLLSGCSAKRVQTKHGDPAAMGQEIPLSVGEVIRLESRSTIDAGAFEAVIDQAGDISFLLGIKVRVVGLTPTAATIEVRKTFQPRYFRHWDYEVVRVQPNDSVERGQSTRLKRNQTSSADGPGG
jgi:hypothetical protein